MIETKQEFIERIEIDFGIQEVMEDSRIIIDLGLDELDIIELQILLDEEFEINVADEDADKWFTVADIIEYLKNQNIKLS